MNIIEKIKEYEGFLIKERRILHQLPEIGLDTYKTCEEIEKVLVENKIAHKKVLGSRGIIATVDSGKPGKCLAIRADMDALEIKEDTDLDFKSQNGYMHACGHDCHMANCLTTLLVLNSMKDKFSGVVKFIFQPGEEYPGGAELMIKEGALENPKVDCIIGHHVGGLFPIVPHGSVGFKSGNLMASMDKFVIKIEGSGGHGSMPEGTIDPIVCLVDIVQAINRIKSREISSSERCVISVCKVNSGINQNIIPSTAEIEGTVRTFNDDIRKYIRKRIGDIAEHYSIANRCKVNYDYAWKYPHLANDETVVESLKKSTRKIFSENIIYNIESETMAADDMSYYLEKVPGAYFMLSNLKMDKNGKTYPNHNAKFDIDEGELYKAVAICVQFALDYLN
ncbi:M20 family metallopeptidase [uncultured Finegoldia sp.]|uniref:M20 metallopeptidase family protein n=1 Tax=uncultured Finegoldia sp. TaxID=328009 RepID=UPI0026224CC0|nr:M20 family metallopeptidase [uncultured Finegoldia sp.]